MNEPVAIVGIRSLWTNIHTHITNTHMEKNYRPADLEHEWWLLWTTTKSLFTFNECRVLLLSSSSDGSVHLRLVVGICCSIPHRQCGNANPYCLAVCTEYDGLYSSIITIVSILCGLRIQKIEELQQHQKTERFPHENRIYVRKSLT